MVIKWGKVNLKIDDRTGHPVLNLDAVEAYKSALFTHIDKRLEKITTKEALIAFVAKEGKTVE